MNSNVYPALRIVLHSQNSETLTFMEDSRLQASHMLQSSLQSNGDRRYATPPQQIAAYNRNSVPQCSDIPMQPPFEPLPNSVDTVFGEKVIYTGFHLNYIYPL